MAPRQKGGGLAQMGEHLLCKQGVVGSIPSSSTRGMGRVLDEREAARQFPGKCLRVRDQVCWIEAGRPEPSRGSRSLKKWKKVVLLAARKGGKRHGCDCIDPSWRREGHTPVTGFSGRELKVIGSSE